MSKLAKRFREYRLGDDWRENFTYLNYTNVEASLKSILNKQERTKHYDRLGNLSGYGMKEKPISEDEKIFRIAVLMESQLEDLATRLVPIGDYEADRKQAKAIAHKPTKGHK
jgi:hypothetical protein